MYRIVTYPEAQEQIAALPAEALDAYAEVLGVLELTPWNGAPQHEDNPDGAVRRWTFFTGQVLYLMLEPQQEVHVLPVQWIS